MATKKKKGKPVIVDNWDDFQILCEEFSKRYPKINPTDAWDCIADRFIRRDNGRHYWKLLRFNWYLTQRMNDIASIFKNNKSRFKKLFEKKKNETLDQHKKRFYKEIGKDNKRIRSVERTVMNPKFEKHYHQYNPNKQFSNLDEVIQLNKMICDYRYDKDFNIKNHDNIGKGYSGQTMIHLLR